MTPPDALDELRKIFREELDDHIATLERESATIAAAIDQRASAREIYRAVHSLKGAARAADAPPIERACHALEGRLDELIRGELDAEAIAAHARAAAEALRLWAVRADDRALRDLGGAIEAGRAIDVERAPRAGADPEPARPSSLPPPSLDATATETVRIAMSRVDALTNASEELVGAIARGARSAHASDDAIVALRADLSRARQIHRRGGEVGPLLERALGTLQTLRLVVLADRAREREAQRAMSAAARDVVEQARAIRVVPLDTLRPALERAANDAAAEGRKEVRFEMAVDGADVDRRVRDGMRDVLLQLVRNAVDHGVEPAAERRALGKAVPATVRVRGEVVGRDVRVVVEDDGRGIDVAEVREAAERGGRATDDLDDRAILGLVFEPGLTTRRTVTAISGRGVGLDVVRQRVAELHGRVEIEPLTPGTRFVILVPLDLGVIRGLVAVVGEVRVVLPVAAVVRVRRVRADDVRTIEGREYVEDSGVVVPLFDLADLLGLERAGRAARRGAAAPCAIVGAGERRAALLVDALLDERDLVVRRPGARLKRAPYVAAAAVLQDGEVAIVVNAAEVFTDARPRDAVAIEESAARKRILVVDDSITTRQLVRSILHSAGYDVVVAADGERAWSLLVDEGVAVDVVVSDIEMPRVDGFQLLSRIRSTPRLAAVPVVLVTALERDVDRQRATDLGASAYLPKSTFDQDELVTTLEALS